MWPTIPRAVLPELTYDNYATLEAALNAMREERDKARSETTYWADQYEMASRGVEEARDALASTALDLKAMTEERDEAREELAGLKRAFAFAVDRVGKSAAELAALRQRLAERDAALHRAVRR
jgi:chromosome segregation ATPase